jgi:hypothetical protein
LCNRKRTGDLVATDSMGESVRVSWNFRVLICLLAGWFLTGCASVSLSKREWIELTAAAPERILVGPFTLDRANVRVDREGDEFLEFEGEFLQEFAGRLAERLSKHVAPAEILETGAKISKGRIWVVRGHFTRLNQGSRALRAFVGFGLGGTKTEARFEVFRVGARGRLEKIAEFETTGGSNAEPGALFSSPFGAVPRLATQLAASGLAADARRTARMVTAAISEKLHSRGDALAGRPLRAKPLGDFPEG